MVCFSLGSLLGLSTSFFSCSMKTKVKMVYGASRIQAGVQPLMRNMGPSFFSDSAMILVTLGLIPSTTTAFCTRLFSTSAGAHTVVATVPATNDARKWVGKPSVAPKFKGCCLVAEYETICDTFIETLRVTFGPKPRMKRSGPLFPADPENGVEAMLVPEPLSGILRTVCAHPDECHLRRIANRTSNATR